MPFLGVSAIERMAAFLERVRNELKPALLARRTRGAGGARRRAARDHQRQRHRWADSRSTASRRPASPIAAAPCSTGASCSRKASSRRRAEIAALLEDVRRRRAGVRLRAARPDDRASRRRRPTVRRWSRRSSVGDRAVLGRSATPRREPGHLRSQARRAHRRRASTASPTGRAILDLAHQPDEWCGIDDLVNATKVIALTLLDLNGMGER